MDMAAKKSKRVSGMLVVKRKGHNESFDERKVYASCYFACLTSHMKKGEAEKLCAKVAQDMRKWLKGKKHVNSQHIFEAMAEIIRKYDEEVAFMYETHRDIS